MRWRDAGIVAGAALLLVGCAREQPTAVRDEQLGIAAVFPGAPEKVRYAIPTPFGQVEWFGRSYQPAGLMDTTFQAEAGNLPPGTEGGATPAEVLGTYHRWLLQRLGRFEREELPPERGPGFRYRAITPAGTCLQGAVVLRRGRLFRAEATTSRTDESRGRAFLDSFQVLF